MIIQIQRYAVNFSHENFNSLQFLHRASTGTRNKKACNVPVVDESSCFTTYHPNYPKVSQVVPLRIGSSHSVSSPAV